MADRDLDGGLADADLRIFKSGYLADATVVCRGREWKVHKLILSTRSKWFRKAFYGGMLESTTGKVILDEEDPDVIELLLHFIYAKGLSDSKGVLALCVKLFRAADFFFVDELKKKAIKELKTRLDKMPVVPGTNPRDDQNPRWITEVVEALEEAWEKGGMDDSLDTILTFAFLNMRKIFRSQDGAALLRRIPDIAVRLLEKHIAGDLGAQAGTTTSTAPRLRSSTGFLIVDP